MKIKTAVITVAVSPSKVDLKYMITHFTDEKTETWRGKMTLTAI